jgi:hypothetical protein
MKRHLEADRMARCILGEVSAADRTHLARCAACRFALEEFGQTLRAFRGSVRDWSQFEMTALESEPKWVVMSTPGTACCIAVMLLLCLLGMQQRSTPRLTPARPDADSALLERVRADVARRVPDGMQPLLSLVSGPEDAPDQALP